MMSEPIPSHRFGAQCLLLGMIVGMVIMFSVFYVIDNPLFLKGYNILGWLIIPPIGIATAFAFIYVLERAEVKGWIEYDKDSRHIFFRRKN